MDGRAREHHRIRGTRLLQVDASRAPNYSFLSATLYLVLLEPFPAETSARQ
jgi:hypothetical protein